MITGLLPSDGVRELSDLPSWFAIKVKANREAIVGAGLRQRGYEEFLPSYRCRRRWSDRIKEIQLPLFPGYIFSRLDVNNRLPILTIPGVVHIVGIQKRPIPIESAEIEALQRVVSTGISAGPWPFLKTGDRVVLGAGPLRDLEGILISEKNELRLILSVMLLQRSVAVEVDRSWILPAAGAPKRVPLALASSAA